MINQTYFSAVKWMRHFEKWTELVKKFSGESFSVVNVVASSHHYCRRIGLERRRNLVFCITQSSMTVSPFVSSWHSINASFPSFLQTQMTKEWRGWKKWSSTSLLENESLCFIPTMTLWWKQGSPPREEKREAGEKTGIKRANADDLPKPRWQMAWFFSEFKLPSNPLLSSHLEAIISLKDQKDLLLLFLAFKIVEVSKV